MDRVNIHPSPRELMRQYELDALRDERDAAHAAGVLEGRAAMRDEIVEWLRGLFAEDALPDAIEATFPTTGDG